MLKNGKGVGGVQPPICQPLRNVAVVDEDSLLDMMLACLQKGWMCVCVCVSLSLSLFSGGGRGEGAAPTPIANH